MTPPDADTNPFHYTVFRPLPEIECPGCGKTFPSECDWCSETVPKPAMGEAK